MKAGYDSEPVTIQLLSLIPPPGNAACLLTYRPQEPLLLLLLPTLNDD
jgi:hypothetical protein